MARTTTVNDVNGLFSKNQDIFSEDGVSKLLGFKVWESYQFYLFFFEIGFVGLLMFKSYKYERTHRKKRTEIPII